MQHQNFAPVEFIVRLFLALGLGALIGLERQLRNHEGGLKTNALVATGSAMFVMMAARFGEPDRIVAQILPGIGFLGAGMIMRDGLHVRGLNTAATLWCSAAIGTLVGAGERAMPALAAGTVVVANVVLREVAVWIDRKHAASGARESGNAGQ
jgi:putative Mg2+ transporter-C (MgtC) family protein